MRPWSIIPIALHTADKNLLFDAAFSTGNNIDPTLWSTIAEDGKLIELNIVDTDGWTINLLEDGDVAFIIVDAKSKSGMKYSALELSLNYIYKMPLPREHVDLGMLSPTCYTFGEHHTGQVATADAADRTRVEGHQDQF